MISAGGFVIISIHLLSQLFVCGRPCLDAILRNKECAPEDLKDEILHRRLYDYVTGPGLSHAWWMCRGSIAGLP